MGSLPRPWNASLWLLGGQASFHSRNAFTTMGSNYGQQRNRALASRGLGTTKFPIVVRALIMQLGALEVRVVPTQAAHSSEARSPVKIAVNSMGRQRPSSLAITARISAGAGTSTPI